MTQAPEQPMPDTQAAPPPDEARIAEAAATVNRLVDAVATVVVGQRPMVEGLVTGLLTGGHVLLEGVPGLAKTLTVSTLAAALDAGFSRIQFTPDLLPADLVGTLIYHPADGTFTPRKGPVFANLVLADEINRAPAKVQSALLEAMQERAVTIGDETHPLPSPFLVLATQNPIEQEGTYPLPEAQVDRFMLKLRVGYPTRAEERDIVARMAAAAPPTLPGPVASLAEIAQARAIVDAVHVDPRLLDYVVSIVHATRVPAEVLGHPASSGGQNGTQSGTRNGRKSKGPRSTPRRRAERAAGVPASAADDLARQIDFGASPRASIALVRAAKAAAFLDRRGFVTPSDIKKVGPDVLRHRVIVSYEAEAEGVDADGIVRTVLDLVPIP